MVEDQFGNGLAHSAAQTFLVSESIIHFVHFSLSFHFIRSVFYNTKEGYYTSTIQNLNINVCADVILPVTLFCVTGNEFILN